MSKFIPLIGFAAVLALSGSAFAQAGGPDTTLGKGQTTPNGKVVCHHDGEVIQSANGPVVCHLHRNNPGVHYYSAQWFAQAQAKSGLSNGN